VEVSVLLLVSLVACGTAEVAPAPAPAPAAPVAQPPAPTSVGQPLDLTALPVDRWYRPYTKDADLTVVVFWEVWCPHCRREVPKLTALDQIEGVQIVGLTRQTKNVKDEDVEKFLADNNVTYAVGHSDDSLHKQLKIKGIPFAVVVDDGKIVWQGNPAGLSEAKLREWL
jgi:protein-disulfide isomerase